MLERSAERILELLSADDLVLDVGGGGKPFPRADWVIDLLPYEERSLYGPPPDPDVERFTAATWVQRDVCERTPWPFRDGHFDFSVCSHTLEDVRDPLFVCSELIRVSRAGYVEVPSRLEEQTYGVHGPWVGWSHHRWLIDVDHQRITFVFKPHVLHARATDHFPTSFWRSLSAEQRVQTFWWQGEFGFAERIFLDGPSLDSYVSRFVSEHRPEATQSGWRRLARRAASRARAATRD